MGKFNTPTECMIAAMESIDDVSAVIILMRHEDGGFTRFIPTDQHPVDSLGMLSLGEQGLRYELDRFMEDDNANS